MKRILHPLTNTYWKARHIGEFIEINEVYRTKHINVVMECPIKSTDPKHQFPKSTLIMPEFIFNQLEDWRD